MRPSYGCHVDHVTAIATAAGDVVGDFTSQGAHKTEQVLHKIMPHLNELLIMGI